MTISLQQHIGLHALGVGKPYSDAITELNPIFYANWGLSKKNAIVAGGSKAALFEVDREVGDDWATHVQDTDGDMAFDKLDDTPRFEKGYYDTSGFNVGPPGILLEGAERNPATNHNIPEVAGCLKTLNEPSPFGDIATTIHVVNGNSISVLVYSGVPLNQTVQLSFYIKRGTGINSAQLQWIQRGGGYTRLMNVEYVSALPVGDWAKVTAQFTNANFSTGWILFTENTAPGHAGGDGDLTIVGFQVEGISLSSVIPSEGIMKYRNLETLEYDSVDNFSTTSGTIAYAFAPKMLPTENPTNGKVLYGVYVGPNNFILFALPTALTDSIGLEHRGGGSSQIVTFAPGFVDRNRLYTLIVTYSVGGNARVYLDGVLAGTSVGTCSTVANTPGEIVVGDSDLNLLAKMAVHFNTEYNQTEVTNLHNLMVA